MRSNSKRFLPDQFTPGPVGRGRGPMKYRPSLMTINLTYHSKPPVQCIAATVKEFQLTRLMLIQFQCLLPQFANNGKVQISLLLKRSSTCMLLASASTLSKSTADDVVIIGCGGHRVTPTAMYDLSICVYGCKIIIPVLIVPGQTDEMILGSNAIKSLLTLLKNTDDYWKFIQYRAVLDKTSV
ncbi:hypothetical protein QQF64_019584 [Cirrhinus molitorella]|uniref:Uncharacterized protein n=1 Tax=Cirrhinus molitorella TaxID=172907 RepID=A0ABR3LFW2_9TELE